MKSDWRRVLCGFLIGCILGAAAGSRLQRAASHRFWQRGPDAERVTRKLAQKLDLDAPQREAVKAIVESHHARIKMLRDAANEKFIEARKSMRAEVRKTLTPSQEVKFDAMAARWDAKRARRRER